MREIVRPGASESAVRLHVGVFFYRQEQYVERSLAACRELLARPGAFDAVRISVYDDGSPDATAARLREEVGSTPGIELHLDPRNQGLRARIQQFVEGADAGETLFIIGGDDLLLPDGMVAGCRDLAERGVDALIANAAIVSERKAGLIHRKGWPYSLINRSPSRFTRFLRTYYPRPLLLQATLFRAEALKRVIAQGWRSRLDDWPLFLRLFSSGCTAEYRPDLVISQYFIHSAGTSASSARLMSLVDEVAQEFGLDAMWGPRSLVAYRRAKLRLAEERVPSLATVVELLRPRALVGLLMERWYRVWSLVGP